MRFLFRVRSCEAAETHSFSRLIAGRSSGGDFHLAINSGRTADRPTGSHRRIRGRYLILAFFLLIGLIVLLESPLTRVRSLSVTGNWSIPASRLLSESGVTRGLNLWQVSQPQVQYNVMSHEPLVQSVAVHTDYLHGTVNIAITQKQIVAVYVHQGQYVRLLSDGTAYDTTTATAGFHWPIVTDDSTRPVKLGQLIANQDVVSLCRVLSRMSLGDLSAVSELHLSDLGVVTLYLDNRFEAQCMVADLKQRLPDVFTAAQYFVNKGYSPGLIDMTGDPPYRYTPFQTVTTHS